MIEKKILREKLRQIRKNISNRDDKDKVICEKFFSLDISYDKALVYINTNYEVGTRVIIQKLFDNNIKVYCPKCVGEHDMEFYRIKSFDDLKIGAYSILEPTSNDKYNFSNNTICLVPGLGFDLNGNRIGYGKGYYDNFLRKNSVISIALCYNEQIQESIPCEKEDERVHFLVSESLTKEV